MLYTASDCAYRLLGVYHIHRNPRNTDNPPRKFVGIGHRVKGNGNFIVPEGTLFAGDGSTLFLPANVAFRNRCSEPEELYIVHLLPLGQTPGDFQLYPDTRELTPLFRKLYEAWQSGQYNHCMSLLYELFSALERPKDPLPPAIAPGVSLLRQNFRDPELTVAAAAKVCFVSEVYFRRVYHQHFGTSPLQDVLQMRFDHATGLLRSGYYTVEQVARLSGFSDVKYFRTAFTKRYGLSPAKWQKQQRS